MKKETTNQVSLPSGRIIKVGDKLIEHGRWEDKVVKIERFTPTTLIAGGRKYKISDLDYDFAREMGSHGWFVPSVKIPKEGEAEKVEYAFQMKRIRSYLCDIKWLTDVPDEKVKKIYRILKEE